MGAAARMPDAAIDLLRIATVEYNLEDNILHIRSNSGNHYQFQAAYAQDIGHLPKWKIALLMGIKAAHAEGEASRPSNDATVDDDDSDDDNASDLMVLESATEEDDDEGQAEDDGHDYSSTVFPQSLLTGNIIVLGSSGNVGKATLAALADAGVGAIAGVRDASPDNPKNAPLLAMNGVSLVQTDMSKPETLQPAISEGSVVFIATPGDIDRTSLVQAAIDAAVAAKAGHIVVISLPVVTVEKSTIFGDQFKAIEEYVKKCPLPYTIVRLPMFMDNLLGQPIKDMSAIFFPQVPDQDFSSISVKDIGCAIANIVRDPAKYTRRTLNLGGVKTNYLACVSAFSKVLGRTINYTQVPFENTKQTLVSSGWPEWMVDGVLQLVSLINDGDPSGLIPEGDDNTIEVLGREADSPEAFMENFKFMFVQEAPPVLSKTGFMKKGGHSQILDTGKKKRFFELSKTTANNYLLTYYTDVDKSITKGIITITGAEITDVGNTAFKIQENREHTIGKLYVLDCETAEDKASWIEVLQQATK